MANARTVILLLVTGVGIFNGYYVFKPAFEAHRAERRKNFNAQTQTEPHQPEVETPAMTETPKPPPPLPTTTPPPIAAVPPLPPVERVQYAPRATGWFRSKRDTQEPTPEKK